MRRVGKQPRKTQCDGSQTETGVLQTDGSGDRRRQRKDSRHNQRARGHSKFEARSPICKQSGSLLPDKQNPRDIPAAPS